MDINSLLASFPGKNLGLNWIDIISLLIIAFYATEGYFLGFFVAIIDFFSFVISFVFGLSLYWVIAKPLVLYLHIPQGFANAIGFLIISIAFEIVFNVIFRKLIFTLPLFINRNPVTKKPVFVEKFLGIIPGALSGIVLCSFILSLIIALPFSVFLKHAVTDSKTGNIFVSNTQVFAKSLNAIFGGAVNDTLSFLTIEPKSNQSLNLNFKTKNIAIDRNAEQQMFDMVNFERTSRGLRALVFSESLTKVGRGHCTDMFKRGYFSHYTKEGFSPFDRMIKSDIIFNYAGENLALAPNATLAMKGLMQSPGHKENILSTNFGKIGIGVIDGGIYGEMFCQEFTD